MKTINFLAGDNATFTTGLGSWVVTGGTAVYDTSTVVLAERHSMVITPTNSSSTVTVTLSAIPISVAYADKSIQFHSRLKSVPGLAVDVSLTHSSTMPASYDQTRHTKTGSNSWSVCRSNIMPIPDIGVAVLAEIELEITGHDGYDIYFTTPFLYGTNDVDNAYFSLSCYASIPRFFVGVEYEQIDAGVLPEFPTLRILESGLSVCDDIFDDYYNIEYVDIETAGRLEYTATPSTLVSPYAVTDTTGAWLAQFLGFELDNPQQTTTPWGGLPGTWGAAMTDVDTGGLSANATSLSRASNVVTATFAASHGLSTNDLVSVTATDGTSTTFSGTFTVTGTPSGTSATWAQSGSDESASETHRVALLDSEWSELEEFNPDYADRAGYTAWQLENAYSGLRCGTFDALVKAAQFNLSGDKVVTVLKHTTGAGSSNPWSILVRTKTSETPGGVDNTSSEIVLTAITAVKPIGFKVEHRCTSTGL